MVDAGEHKFLVNTRWLWGQISVFLGVISCKGQKICHQNTKNKNLTRAEKIQGNNRTMLKTINAFNRALR